MKECCICKKEINEEKEICDECNEEKIEKSKRKLETILLVNMGVIISCILKVLTEFSIVVFITFSGIVPILLLIINFLSLRGLEEEKVGKKMTVFIMLGDIIYYLFFILAV